MPENYLDKVYSVASAPDAQRTIYDAWATSYDEELVRNGYATPERLARALAGVADRAAPVLDFGCGTGLSGEALAAAGFTTIDGCDISAGMVEIARAKGVYRALWELEPDRLDVPVGAYGAIVACGVISVGAAPAELLNVIAQKVGPGGMLAFSFNDHTDEGSDYVRRLEALLAGDFAERVREHGPHIPGLGSTSTVYVLKRV